MYNWTFNDFLEPFPHDQAGASAHKNELIAEIIMIRDQLQAVSNGDAKPPSDTWAFEATTYRRKLQSRCNAINHHIENLPVKGKASRDKTEFRALKEYVKTLGPDVWEKACEAMNAAQDQFGAS